MAFLIPSATTKPRNQSHDQESNQAQRPVRLEGDVRCFVHGQERQDDPAVYYKIRDVFDSYVARAHDERSACEVVALLNEAASSND